MNVKALILDFDGTMLDTETSWYEAYKEIYREHGAELPLELFVQCVGTSLDHGFDPYRYLEECTGKALDREQLRLQLGERHRRLMDTQELRPGIREIMKEAKDSGCKLAIASSSHLRWIMPFLERFAIQDQFDVICTADLVKKVKPDPELYQIALQKLEVAAEQALAVEDSAHGAHAAVKAGIFCVVVPNAVTAHLQFPAAVRRLESLSGHSLQELTVKR